MTIEVTDAAIQKIGQRMVRYMTNNNREPLSFKGATSEFGLNEILDTLKTLGVPCALLGKDAYELYTGVVIAGQTFRVDSTKNAKQRE